MRARGGRPPTLWLQILLVGGLACVLLVLVQAYRAHRTSTAVAERALRDYAHFAAWSYREHLVVRLREVAGELLGAVNHGDQMHLSPRIPPVQELGHYLPYDESCACHTTRYGPLPARFLGLTLGSDTVAIGVNHVPRGSPGWLSDVPDGARRALRAPSPDEERMLNRALSDMARHGQGSWGYAVRILTIEGRPHLIGVRAMPTSWGDTVVYAFDHDAEALDAILSGLLASEDLLPSTVVGGRRNADVVDVEVTDASQLTLYRSWSANDAQLAAVAALPPSFGAFRVIAQMRPEMAEAILIGGVPRSRVPIMLVILAIALGLTILAAVQLRREVRFAAERATFVANVSHELRTPLAQVRLVLDTMRLGRMGNGTTQEASLGVADREVLRLQHLVDGLLRFTAGPRRNGAPAVPIDASAEARAVAAEFEPLARQHAVTVHVDSDESVTARLSNGVLRQVLLNLLDNAVKYGGDGGTVTVRVRRLSGPGGGVSLTVEDSGPGIASADRQRIWGAFQRGELAKRRAVGGSGIGLTIVREIAKEHGGRAEVERAPGGGARFVIELPDLPD
jgi:signal transduction histidine kinase